MNGSDRIAAERKRQIEKEGWTAEHDAGHDECELLMAAICYAAISSPLPRQIYIEHPQRTFVDPWPRGWDGRWDKRHKHRYGNHGSAKEAVRYAHLDGRVRCLEIAGALIAAEIDRIKHGKDGD